MPPRGAAVSSSFDSSSRTRSAEMRSISGASSVIAARVPSSTSKPSWAEKRAARSIRSGSSPNDCSGAAGVRSVFASRSSTPPDGSTSVELRQPQRERVDGEVAAGEVVLEARAEHDLGLARVAVVGVGAVGRDLDGLARDLRADRAERAADVPVRLGDRLHDREDLVGRGIRGEIEVVDAAAEERVAHRAADEGELVARGLESRGERRDGRRSRQLAQPVEGRRDTLHAPYVKRARDMPLRLWTPSGCPEPTP